MSQNSNSKWIMIGVVIGLLIGGLAGYLISPSPDTSGYQEQIEQLETQVTTLQNRAQDLEVSLEQSNADRDEYLTLYQSVVPIAQLHEINFTQVSQYLMAPKPEFSWEEGQFNPDIQGLLVVRTGDWWADDLYEELKEEFEANGGGILQLLTYHGYTSRQHLAARLDNPWVTEFIEYYGMNHTAIIFLGGPEIHNFFIGYPENTILDELPAVGLSPCSSKTSAFTLYNPIVVWIQHAPWD